MSDSKKMWPTPTSSEGTGGKSLRETVQETLTLSPPASPARIYPLPENSAESTPKEAAYSTTLSDSIAILEMDRDTCQFSAWENVPALLSAAFR